MKALLLSGGKGTRLRPITYTSAKQLIPVANKPVLFYGLEAIAEAGIEDVGVIVGETIEEVKRVVGDGSQWGLDITYIEQSAPLGLAHTVKIAESFLKGEPFVMYLGDNLIKQGISQFVKRFEEDRPNSLILLSEVENPEQFGVAELENGRIINLVEKPDNPKSNLALVGLYIFDENIFPAVNSIEPSWRGELEITDAIQYLVENDKEVHPYIIEGWWKDTGKKEDVLEANRIMLEDLESDCLGYVDKNSQIYGRVLIEKGARVEDSIVRGPAIIGEDSIIKSSFIGPYTSLYKDVKIINSEIEHSIILENSVIADVSRRIEATLIGNEVEVKEEKTKPSSYSLMLGDNSQINLS
ncbi:MULTISPECIES: glucose-1-phosphate thymidylyltransferase [unclassified Candidatus Frackibacter]|uniref:glucose-1-phosphate thymidylyltransferase n=1 Tax=unclassified Candidatus Frackibacter TaxID=2648818 RepID=UPI00088E6D80|nr:MULTISPECIES: glucose-1-phosphate thymidylyltransferase [unclassified Candidatus Frackibacter]SDC55177.1 glucose-1-phosphate thymidylyltransferase [Candidatus Frackibacter sp. WG11]SEM67255.1 glucose-1-phosphate thymidylyltransferase [Candidatus Frackibacter sp. WG12]SFL78527.1 glucose-1-phosphate thymidylyltransferase [Candidatus Frackibacter sp. WG13]